MWRLIRLTGRFSRRRGSGLPYRNTSVLAAVPLRPLLTNPSHPPQSTAAVPSLYLTKFPPQLIPFSGLASPPTLNRLDDCSNNPHSLSQVISTHIRPMMASFMSYFGARRDPKQSAREAIVGLRQQLQMLEKKEEYLQKKIEEELKKAKANAVSNKAGAHATISSIPHALADFLIDCCAYSSTLFDSLCCCYLRDCHYNPLLG